MYGLAACVWSESISLALDVAPQIKAGVVWINTANQFDAACGFGGILYKVITSGAVLELITGVISRAFKLNFL